MRSKYLLCAVSLLLAAACFAAEPAVKIGVSTSLTSDAGTYGLDMRDFMLFASEKLAPGRYQLVFEDDRCSGKDAVSVAHKLINVDQVRYVTGFPCSGATLAALPIYEKAGVLTLVAFASSPRIADGGDFVFRTFPSDREAAGLLYRSMRRYSRIGVLSELTEYAQDFKNALREVAEAENREVFTEDFLPRTIDFKTPLLNLKKKNIDALFINPQAEMAFVTVLKDLQDLHMKLPLFGAYWPGSPSLLKVAGKGMEAVTFVDSPALSEILNPDGRALYREFQQRFGEIRSTETAFASAFEAFRVLHLAIQSGQEPRQFLYETKFNGIFGPYSFDEKGEIKGFSLVMKRIRNGRAELLLHGE